LETVLANLKVELSKVLEKKDIIVDEITFYKKGKYQFLTIVLDKVGGIDLECIVDASKDVNEIVDNFDITDDSFILDVISKERG
jgi:Uncharacterised BCR, YhbC family COG0779.